MTPDEIQVAAERISIRWAGTVVQAEVLRRFKNGRIRVEITPAPRVSGQGFGRPGTPARTERMTIEPWQEVKP